MEKNKIKLRLEDYPEWGCDACQLCCLNSASEHGCIDGSRDLLDTNLELVEVNRT